MSFETRVYQRPWRGTLVAASIGYLAFMPMWAVVQALNQSSTWESIPGFFAGLSGGVAMGLVAGLFGFVMVVGAIFWVAALILARALLQAAESWRRHAIKVLAVGGATIGLFLGVAATWLLGGASSGPAAATLAVGLIDGLMAAAVLHATAGRRRAVDVSAVF